jgi:hypothetical protein
MKERKKVAKQDEKGRADKAAYSPPRLIEFGPVGVLTQSGTGSRAESVQVMMGIPSCQSNTMRSRC